MAFQKRDVKDKVVQYPGRYQLVNTSNGQVLGTFDLTAVPGIVTEPGTSINKAYLQPIEQILYELLLVQDIPGTTQTPIYSHGNITQITHQDVGNNILRTDTFSYTSSLITEVRTLSTGESLTLKYYFNSNGSYNRTEVI